jgi:serine/threonine protein kinase/phosphoribosyl 1,2-cyclic phosphodiesterase/anti-anti-sigma regulatory factor
VRGTAGGDTACIELRTAGNLLIFDCGSGLRRLGLELMKEEFGRGKGVAHIFIAHTHWDHMMGWPFFVPGFIPGNKFFFYGVHPDLEERFRIQQTAPSMFPIPFDYQSSDSEFIILQEGETIEIGQTRVKNLCFPHPGDSYGYRVEDNDAVFIYCGDAEFKSLDHEETGHYVEFFRDADAMVFDAMFSLHDSYRFEDWGHSSAVAGADLATRAGVRRLLLFHHAPASTDEQIWSLRDVAEAYLKQHPERPPCQVYVAYDGLEMELWREAKLETDLEHLKEGIVVHLSGRLVDETDSIAQTAFDQACAQANGRPLVANLEKMTDLDRAGLKTLFAARRDARPLGLCNLSRELRRTLSQAGALDHFAIFETPDRAFAALKQGLELRPGQVLSERYQIGKRLERGPLGDVYLATDQSTRRQVILQVICSSLGPSHTSALMDTARAMTDLRHPSIADVLGADQDGHIKYLVTEYTPGRSLRQLLEAPAASPTDPLSTPRHSTSSETATALSPAQAVRIGTQIAEALEYAHSRNKVHGGLKPQDIILFDDGSIQVCNFGVGRLVNDKPLNELPIYMGALSYLAPEQFQGHAHNPSSDLYALGAILYEMLTAEPPLAVDGRDADLIGLQLRQPPVPLRRRNPNVSRTLEHLVHSLLEKTPEARPSAASIARQALHSLVPPLDEKPVLGRDTLCQTFSQHLERISQGQSGMLVVEGGRGVGKSRFVRSIANEHAAKAALTTLCGELFAYENTRTFELFGRALRRPLLNLPGHQLSKLLTDLGDLSHPLTALIPELRSNLSVSVPLDTDGQGLEEAVCETLRIMTKSGPVLLILDGLQWIDATSLRLLDRVVRQRIPRLLIIALYRTEEIDQDHPVQQVLDDLDFGIDERLRLGALGPIEIHQMASAVGGVIPPDFGLWLYSETAGNPLYTEQLIQAYLEGPSETRQPSERASSKTLEDVVLRRLERLPNGTLATLRQAAVLGHNFRFERLRASLDQPERQVLSDLDSALQVGLVLGQPSGDLYEFGHPLIREVIYTEMLGGVRKRYHARVARVLEQEGVSNQLDKRIDLLAHHFYHAAEHEKAIGYLARATRRARHLGANESALEYVNLALEMVEHLLRIAPNEREREQRRKQRDDLLAARTALEAKSTAQ